LPYIVRFGPYHPHGFFPGDASPLLSLTPQNAYDKLATSTLNKAIYHSFTRRCEILQSTPLKKPDDPVGTTGQPVRSALIPNVAARPNLPCIIRFGPYHPHGFVPGDPSPLLSLTPQNAYDKLATSTLNKVIYHSLSRRCGILSPNLPYTVRFGPYHPQDFVFGDANPLLSLTPQNEYDKLATNTLNKAIYHSLTRRCGILSGEGVVDGLIKSAGC
jgi:hypothetical protein